jgi:hypothetical protein
LDDRRPAAAQDPVHLVEGGHWLGEVLEGGLAEDQVERLPVPWHVGGVAMPEVRADFRPPSVLVGDLHEATADVQPDHLKPAESRYVDG